MDSSRKRRTPSSLSIQHAKGGYIVRHSYDNMGAGESYQPPTEHVFSKHADLMAHLHAHTKHAPEAAADHQKPAPTAKEGVAASRRRGSGVD